MVILQAICAIAGICGILYCCLSLYVAGRFHARRRFGVSDFTPPVSILKPLCGLDPHAYESLRSHCLQDYPEFEIVFGVADPDDPVVPLVQDLTREFPRLRIQMVVCSRTTGMNFKVSNLVQMLAVAQYEYVVINDSDICVPKDYLRSIVAPFATSAAFPAPPSRRGGRADSKVAWHLLDRRVDPSSKEGLENARITPVGLVTCLYRGVRAKTIGSRLESLAINSDFMPGVLVASWIERGLHFALGSTLAFRRDTLLAVGGLEPLADYLADDYELGYRITQSGFRVELAPCIVEHHLPAYSLADFAQHQLRWARTIRAARPDGYAGLIFTFAIPWTVLGILAARGASWSFLLFFLAVFLRLAVAFLVGSAVLGDRQVRRDFWLLPLRDFLAVMIWIASYMGRHVVWRGKKFELMNGRLRQM